MGEVVVLSSDDGMEMTKNKGLSSEIVRWEKYMPKTVLRVLLVESDDSTRQIITALLRKCCYKVTAVSDGLAAWEILKGKTHNIDLILTELDLPSISGFALLSLVMENEACKNIPVIMMSCQDSITMVLKCMLKGAADYLIKPLRKNELKNLWQHVWRRLSLGNNPIQIHSLPASQHNIEDSDEFSADSRYHSDQGSGAQGISRGNDYIAYSSQDKLVEKKVESFDVTMDLIGGIDKGIECFYGDKTHEKDTGPELGLSLKRSCSVISENQDESKHQKLSLSDASPFLRYENDTPGQKTGEASSSAGPKTPTESHEKLSKVRSDHGSVTTSSNQENIGSSTSGTLHQTQQLQEQTHQSTLNNNEEIARQSSSLNSTEKLKQEEGFNILTQEGLRGTLEPQRTNQREAALMKFRLKRKDRCFDKKVRYQSRKKLAEQRPRVKGQFVRADASNKA